MIKNRKIKTTFKGGYMQNFMKDLVLEGEASSMPGTFRNFKALDLGDYKVSIQGSYNHYCKPRETIEPESYSEMEIAIFNKDGWVQPREDEFLQNFSRISELINCYEVGSCAVGGWVPVDMIQNLIDYISSK